MRLARSNSPPIPRVELTTNRDAVWPAREGSACRTSLANVIGRSRFASTLWTASRTPSGTLFVYASAVGRSVQSSIFRLNAKISRLVAS